MDVVFLWNFKRIKNKKNREDKLGVISYKKKYTDILESFLQINEGKFPRE